MIGLDEVTTTVGLPTGETTQSSDDDAIFLKRGLEFNAESSHPVNPIYGAGGSASWHDFCLFRFSKP